MNVDIKRGFKFIFIVLTIIFLIPNTNADITGKLFKIEEYKGKETTHNNFYKAYSKFIFSNNLEINTPINQKGEYSLNTENIFCWNNCNIYPTIYLKGISIYEDDNFTTDINIKLSNDMPKERQNMGLFTNLYGNEKVKNDGLFIEPKNIDNTQAPTFTIKNGINENGYSVFWNGTLIIPSNNKYNFFLNLSGHVKIWIDNELVLRIEKYNYEHKEYNYTRYLNRGNYSIKIEYLTSKEYGNPNILWSSKEISKEIIPKENLIFLSGGTRLIDNKIAALSSWHEGGTANTVPSGTWYYLNRLETSKRPILFVHGWGNDFRDVGQWGSVPEDLENMEHECLELVYNPANLDNKKNAGMLKSIINQIKSIYSSFENLDIVAHSMGGLVVRGYIESLGISGSGKPKIYEEDIRKFIIIGSPMYGTYKANLLNDDYPFHYSCTIADLLKRFLGGSNLLLRSEATANMAIGSDFLWELNNHPPDMNVDYLTIGGFEGYPIICFKNYNQIDDGIVPMNSANLLQYGIPHITLESPHLTIHNNYQTIGIIDDFINDRSVSDIKENLDYNGEYYIDPDDPLADLSYYNPKGNILISFTNPDTVNTVYLKKDETWYYLTKNPRTSRWLYLNPPDSNNWDDYDYTHYTTELMNGNYELWFGTDNLVNSEKQININPDSWTLFLVDNQDNDSDSVINMNDNCPSTLNPSQADCNDDGTGDACDTINPTATEYCDTIDNNCNDQTDEEGICDNVCTLEECLCSSFGAHNCAEAWIHGIVDRDTSAQCNEWFANGIPETCNGRDDNCDGNKDEGGVCGGSEPSNWQLTIQATNQLEPITIGMNKDATDNYDQGIDEFTSAIGPNENVIISLYNGVYQKNIKAVSQQKNWSLSIGVPIGQTTTLSWSNIPTGINITMYNQADYYDLNSISSIGINEGSHEFTITAIQSKDLRFTLSIDPGWNMISIPLIPKDNTTETLFGDCVSTLDTEPILKFDSPLFEEVTEIKSKVGYWLFSTEATTCDINGAAIDNRTLILEPGWNMVGTVELNNLDTALIPNQVPQRPPQKWSPPLFEDTSTIEPGTSIWVFVTEPTEITI